MQWLPWLQMARTEMRHSKWFEYLSECEMSASSWIIFTRERCRRSMCSKNLLCLEARVRTLYAQWDKQCWCWNGYSVFYIFYEGARFKGWKRVPKTSTLCEKLKGPDFLPHPKLQDLLQDVLPLGFLHDTHSFQFSVRQSHQSSP